MRSISERFWPKTQRSKNGCLEWTGYRTPEGYGVIVHGGRQRAAHRVAWELSRGEIPQGLCVCHRCDNPPCVDPDHLFLGTNQDNTLDRCRKGRSCSGERHPSKRDPKRWTMIGVTNQAVLTEEQVKEIRAKYRPGYGVATKVANIYGVDRTTIGLILNGKTWRHLL